MYPNLIASGPVVLQEAVPALSEQVPYRGGAQGGPLDAEGVSLRERLQPQSALHPAVPAALGLGPPGGHPVPDDAGPPAADPAAGGHVPVGEAAEDGPDHVVQVPGRQALQDVRHPFLWLPPLTQPSCRWMKALTKTHMTQQGCQI